MTSAKLENETTGEKRPRIEIRMLSFAVEERTEIAQLLTGASYSVSNESAANYDRFEHRLKEDEWDVIFVDARIPFESVSLALDLVREFTDCVPVFAMVESHQKNQADLMEHGVADLFTADDLQRLPGVVTRELEASDNRTMALEARRLQDEINFAGNELGVLAKIGQLVSSSLDIGQIFDQVVEQIQLLIPLDTAAIAVADVETNSINLEYVSGQELPGFPQGKIMPMSEFTSASQLARFVLVLDTGLLEEMRSEYEGIKTLLDAGVKSIMATPLIHNDEVVGFLATTSSEENAYGPEHVEAAERIGTQISGALANSRLHARISYISGVREFLVQLGREAASARDIRAVYESVFRNLKNLLPLDRGVIALQGDDGKSLIIDHVDGHEIDGLCEGDVVDLNESSIAVLSQSHLINVDTAHKLKTSDPTGGKLATAGFPSSMRTPLRSRDSVIGVLTVSASAENVYAQRHMSLLERVSDQISPVIESLNLQKRVQSLAAAVESTLDLFAITDLEGITSYLNPAGLRMLGLDEDDSGIGVNLKDFLSTETADAIRTVGLQQAANLGGWQSEISLTPTGADAPIPVELLLVPAGTQNGEMTSVNVFMRDLRDREAVRVERREFVSTVSHELRTPLTSMKMYTDMLGEGDAGELNPQQKRLVTNLQSTVDRLTRMVDDLNVVSMLEAGRFTLQTETFDMNDLVASAVEISNPSFVDRNMTIQVIGSGASASVDSDRERMLQVMVNLLNNAAKYAEAGTKTTVTVLADEQDVRVEVADRGPGIAGEDLVAIFESFYRGENVRSSRIPGSGLGLSIARGFVEAQGGRIWAESELGKGSTFIFTLPLNAE